MTKKDPYISPWFTVCADTFTDKEAGKVNSGTQLGVKVNWFYMLLNKEADRTLSR